MHELAITENMIALVMDQAKGAPVQGISLEIGQLTALLPEAMQFCFEACVQGTVLEGATLEIVEIPGLGRCRQCGAEVPLTEPFGLCDCGSVDLVILQGQELILKRLDLLETQM